MLINNNFLNQSQVVNDSARCLSFSNFHQMPQVPLKQQMFPSPPMVPVQAPIMLPPIQVNVNSYQTQWSQPLTQAMAGFNTLYDRFTPQNGAKFGYVTDHKSTRVMYHASQEGVAELNNASDFYGELIEGSSPPEDACICKTEWKRVPNSQCGDFTVFIKETEYYDPMEDSEVLKNMPQVTDKKRDSITSFSSKGSDLSLPYDHFSKGELAHHIKALIIDDFQIRYKGVEGAVEKEQKEGLRGPMVVRVKCCTIKALRNIRDFLEEIDMAGLIRKLSCPLSRKKGGHVNGFQCYIQLKSEEDIKVYFEKYEQFQKERGYLLPKKIEHNPRSTAQKKADEEAEAIFQKTLQMRVSTGSPPAVDCMTLSAAPSQGAVDTALDVEWDGAVPGFSPSPCCVPEVSCPPNWD